MANNIDILSPNTTEISSLSSNTTNSSLFLNNQKYIDNYISEKKKLASPRLGVMSNLHIAIVYKKDDNILPKDLEYKSHDLCSILNQYKNTHIKAYFHPNHTCCREVNSEMDINNVVEDKETTPKIALMK